MCRCLWLYQERSPVRPELPLNSPGLASGQGHLPRLGVTQIRYRAPSSHAGYPQILAVRHHNPLVPRGVCASRRRWHRSQFKPGVQGHKYNMPNPGLRSVPPLLPPSHIPRALNLLIIHGTKGYMCLFPIAV
jgi:hypothetical protein